VPAIRRLAARAAARPVAVLHASQEETGDVEAGDEPDEGQSAQEQHRPPAGLVGGLQSAPEKWLHAEDGEELRVDQPLDRRRGVRGCIRDRRAVAE